MNTIKSKHHFYGELSFHFTFLQLIYSIIKDEKRYDPEVSDTTMLTIAVSLFGQKNNTEPKRIST